MSIHQLVAHYINSANAQNLQRDFASALKASQLATSMAPNVPQAWYNLGVAEAGLGHMSKALRAFAKAQGLSPNNAEMLNGIAIKLIEHNELDSAEKCLQRALALAPNLALVHSNFGTLRSLQGRTREAEPFLRRAVELQPDLGILHANLGSALHVLEAYQEAETVLRRALELDPQLTQAWKNLAVVLTSLRKDEEAIKCYEEMLKLSPENAEARWGLALLQIKKQRYEEGWKNFEARWHVPDLELKPISTSAPQWTGEDAAGSLLLWGEQGIGDQILFSSVLHELSGYQQRKLVALDRRLIPLFKRSLPGFEFLDLKTISDSLGYSAQLPLGSLPRFFRRTAPSFRNAQHPYLKADPDRAASLRQKVQRPGRLVCGISWNSNRHLLGKHKSISLEDLLKPLQSRNLHFVNLQYGDTAREREDLRSKHGIEVQSLDEIDCFQDLDGMAALVTACDIVLTISNSTAHLSGALGKRTLLVLPWTEGRLWYWADHNGHTPWYPSIEMLVQEHAGDWSGPMEAVQRKLDCLLQQQGDT